MERLPDSLLCIAIIIILSVQFGVMNYIPHYGAAITTVFKTFPSPKRTVTKLFFSLPSPKLFSVSMIFSHPRYLM